MSDNYKRAEQATRRFFEQISSEADALNAKINSYADRMGRITKQQNPAEFDAIIQGSATDLGLFAQRIEALLPDYTRNVELLNQGFAETVKSLDPATDAGAQELEGMRREARALADTARGVKAKVTTLRNVFVTMRDANYDHRLTQSAHRVISTDDNLFAAYEDLETLGLNVAFAADQK
jgi:hypothetical protein